MEEGKKGHGVLKGLIEEHIRHFTWLTRNMVSHYIITFIDKNIVPLVIATFTKNQTVVSGLTDASPVAMATSHLIAITTPTGTTTAQESVSVPTSKRGGRPTGSTHCAIDEKKILVVDDVDEFVIEIPSLNAMYLYHTQKHNDGTRWCVHRGTFEKVSLKVNDEYNLDRNEIQVKPFLSRNKVGRKLKVNHRGTTSPMAGIEGHLLAVIIRRAALRQPVYCAEGLELANSVIEGTTTQIDLMM
jgi:hypothetical protein